MTRRKWLLPGCLILLLLLIALVVLGAPAALALRLAGLRAQGSVESYFETQTVPDQPTIPWDNPAVQPLQPTPTPAGTPDPKAVAAALAEIDPAAPQPLEALTVDVWFLAQPQTFYAPEIFARRLERGLADDGRTAYYIDFNQEGINTYLSYWFGGAIASGGRVRNAWIDLRPGGAVIYADVDLELGWQKVGAVFMLDATGRQLILTGVDVGGRFYSIPPAGRVAELASQLESQGNRALADLTFLDPAGALKIQTIRLAEDSVQILAY